MPSIKQILAIIAVVMVVIAEVGGITKMSFFVDENKLPTKTKNLMIAGAIILISASVIYQDNGTSESMEQKAVPAIPAIPPRPPPFIQREGMGGGGGNQIKSAEGFKKDGKSLGQQLKDAGWVVVLADWCGFCKRQKAMFAEYPDAEFDLIVLDEEAGKANDKLHIQGFPHWECTQNGKQAPGFKPTIEMIAKLLE